MMTGERISVDLAGSGPSGFRLQGGDGQPLRVSKVRRRSKADGHLKEGDILLAVNGVVCDRHSYARAMELVDGAGSNLRLDVIRPPGAGQPYAPQGGIQVFPPHTQSYHEGMEVSVPYRGQPQHSTHTETFQEGGVTRQVTTDQYTQDLGNSRQTTTTVRQTSTQRAPVRVVIGGSRADQTQGEPQYRAVGFDVTHPQYKGDSHYMESDSQDTYHSDHNSSASPYYQGQITAEAGHTPYYADGAQNGDSQNTTQSGAFPQFRVTNFRASAYDPNASSWQNKEEKRKSSNWQPSDGARVIDKKEHNDGRVTMTIGGDIFGMSHKIPGGTSYSLAKKQKPKTPSPEPVEEPPQVPMRPPNYDNRPARPFTWHPPGQEEWGPDEYQEPEPEYYYDEEDNGDSSLKLVPVTDGMEPIDAEKLFHDPTEDVPEYAQKKKMFADSAFFDDPEQTYPTIEEQIDLARKVANVLTAEGAQRNSKGAKMFAKRQERSEKWTLESVGKGADSHTSEDSNLAPPIYNPLMANKPKPFSLSKFMQQNLAPDAEEAPIEHIPPNKMKINPLELENMRLKSTKSKPNIGDPNQCFSLAAALHSAKGKGGQIFAKRRAKSEKWVIDESNVKKSPHPPPQPRSGPTIYSKRGSETIAMKKSSPWEAAETGDMERAFKPVPSKRHTIIGGTVKPQPPGEENIPPVPQTNFKAEHKAGPAFRDFNYRARGWGGSKVVNKNQPVYTGPSKDFNTQPQPFTPPEGISQPEPHEPVDFNVHPTPFGQDRSSRMSGGVYDYEEIGSDL